jgi:hypothetical protein
VRKAAPHHGQQQALPSTTSRVNGQQAFLQLTFDQQDQQSQPDQQAFLQSTLHSQD